MALSGSEVVFYDLQQSGSKPADAELAEAYEKAANAESYQTSLPEPEDLPQLEIPPFMATLIEIFGWVFLGCVVAFLVVLALRLLMTRRRRLAEEQAAVEEEGQGVAIRAEDMEIDLNRIKTLAAQGDLAEAIHLLLLQTLQSLGGLLKVDLDPSWTSREILAEIKLESAANEALESLVSRVEISHFGDTEPSQEDFEQSLEAYEAFLCALKSARS